MIEFRNVTKTYDTGTKAIKGANFVIDKGERRICIFSRIIRKWKINTNKINTKRRRTNIRKNNNKWKRHNIFKTKPYTIFKKKYGSCIPRFQTFTRQNSI